MTMDSNFACAQQPRVKVTGILHTETQYSKHCAVVASRRCKVARAVDYEMR